MEFISSITFRLAPTHRLFSRAHPTRCVRPRLIWPRQPPHHVKLIVQRQPKKLIDLSQHAQGVAHQQRLPLIHVPEIYVISQVQGVELSYNSTSASSLHFRHVSANTPAGVKARRLPYESECDTGNGAKFVYVRTLRNILKCSVSVNKNRQRRSACRDIYCSM
jgi:hypothetical protein